MHICFITHEYPKPSFSHGGIGTFIQTIGKALVSSGHKVSIVGINNYNKIDETIKDEGVSIYRLKPSKLKGLIWFFNSEKINAKLKEVHAKKPIDIIETPELGLAFIKKIKPIKYVIRLHGGHHFFSEAEKRGIHPWKGFQEKKSFKKADAFIAVSKYVKNHTENYLSYRNKPVEVISSPINLDVFNSKLEVQIEEDVILFAGTVCEKKGVKHFILSMAKVFEKYPNIKLHIYGRDWFFKDGTSYIDYLKSEVVPQLGANAKQISFKGVLPLEELAVKYETSKMCVFPSLMETQGLAPLEAMAMGKLVIYSSYGPGPEAIEHKETGLLCEPNIINTISDAIIWGIENDVERREIGKRAEKFISEHYNIPYITEENIRFYKSIL